MTCVQFGSSGLKTFGRKQNELQTNVHGNSVSRLGEESYVNLRKPQSFGHQWKEVRNSVEWRKALERKRKELCNGRLMMNIEQLISFDYTIFIIHRCVGLADSLGARYNFV